MRMGLFYPPSHLGNDSLSNGLGIYFTCGAFLGLRLFNDPSVNWPRGR